MNEYAGIVLRVTVIFFYVLALLRLSGKRSIGGLSPLDFAVAAIIGDMVGDIYMGEIPMAEGLVGLATIVFMHTLTSLVESRSNAAHRVLNGEPVAVMIKGMLERRGMARERTGESEIWQEVRSQGIEEEKAGEIREASWEINGKLAVIRHEWAEPLQKDDLPKLKRKGQGKQPGRGTGNENE